MRLLVINNKSNFIESLKNILSKYEVTIVPFNEISLDEIKKFDKIILSGGHSLCVKNHDKDYQKELEIIKKSGKPIFGICLGFELIGYAFGEKLEKIKPKEKGIIKIEKIKDDRILFGLNNRFEVYESHRWVIKNTNFLVPLAKSKDGIEIVKHPDKKIYGSQFHPEVFVEKTQGHKIIENFLHLENFK